MAINPTGMIKNLGWGRFFQLLVHLPSFLRLFAQLAKDPRVNIAPKLVILGVLAYVVLPTDLVPDFIPGLGYTDDVVVLLACSGLFILSYIVWQNLGYYFDFFFPVFFLLVHATGHAVLELWKDSSELHTLRRQDGLKEDCHG